jgi:hypothetical protein
MDAIGFLCLSLGSSTVQLHDGLGTDVHAHVQRLVSVVKTTTILEGYTTEEQSAVVRFCGQRDSMQMMSIKNVSYLRWEVFVF